MIKKSVIIISVFRSARQMNFSFLEPDRKETSASVMDREPAGGLKDELVAECREILTALRLHSLADRLEVEWNRRMRSTAGRATWPIAVIELNPNLLKISREEVRRTVLHELAHLVAYERAAGRRITAHGPEWQRACSDVGIPGEKATHDLALPSRTLRRKWHYACPACGTSFERVRRFKGRVACYDCCRENHSGEYHDRFRLIETDLLGPAA